MILQAITHFKILLLMVIKTSHCLFPDQARQNGQIFEARSAAPLGGPRGLLEDAVQGIAG